MNNDGFTTPYVVDLQSGTWMEAEGCVVLRLTSDQTNRFDEMSDTERVDYVARHGIVSNLTNRELHVKEYIRLESVMQAVEFGKTKTGGVRRILADAREIQRFIEGEWEDDDGES